MDLKRKTLALLMVPMLLLALAGNGCTSTTTNAKNYPTLKQTQTNVTWPMTRYRNAVAAFVPISQAEMQRVNAAYEGYQAAFKTALADAHGNYDAPTPDNVKALAAEVIRVTETIPYQ